MPQRFGQATDYSQNFAYLAQSNYQRMEQAAERVDRRREEELAAKDAEMFTRYQEGKVSGREILAYIQRRIGQTGYDKAQQAKWRATLVEYRNAVSDEEATAKYEQTGNLGDYIAHWKRRLSGTKSGTPERTQIAKMLSDLREQRDQKGIQRGAEAIMRRIKLGKASTKDLIDFYKEQLGKKGLSSDIRSQIRNALADVKAQYKSEQYTVAQLKVDELLASGQLTPQEAAERKQANAEKYDIAMSDPVGYQQLQGQIRVLQATPDPKEVAKAEADLIAGTITKQEFADKMDAWADMIAPFDQQAAWELRGDARQIRKDYEEAQRLENPGVIGQSGQVGSVGASGRATTTINNFIGKNIAVISQLDGSRYSQINCTMAAGAMVGYTMGLRKGMTGADLRATTGDTSGGTTLLQAKYALEQAGAKGLQYKNGFEFDKFKSRIKQGSTAIVSGYLGNMGGTGFNNAGWRANHSVTVVRFDPKKGFLVLDPAINRKGYKGTWVSEAALQKFAWTGSGLGAYSRNGSVLFSPRGTLKTRWNKGKTYDPRKTSRTSKATAESEKSKKGSSYGGYVDIEEGVAFINTETPAQTEEGQVYVGQHNPGPDWTGLATEAIIKEAQKSGEYDTPAHLQRLENAGINPGDEGLDTREEVVNEVARRTKDVAQLQGWVTGFAEVFDGSDGPFLVTNGSQSRMLSRADISEMEKELVMAFDGLALLNEALGNYEASGQMRQGIAGIISVSQSVTTTDMLWERNTLMQNGIKEIRAAEGPEATKAAIEKLLEDLGEFNANWSEDEEEILGPLAPGEMPTEQSEALDQLGQPADVVPVGDPDKPDAKEPNDMILGDSFQAGLAEILEMSTDGETPPEVIEQFVGMFADQHNLELPSNWPDPPKKGDEPTTGFGADLAELVANRNVGFNLDNELGEMVLINGTEVYVPYVRQAGMTTGGERAEGVDTITGEEIGEKTGAEIDPEMAEAGIAYGTGATKMLDIDYLRTTLEVEIPAEFTVTADGLPKVFVMEDGEAVAKTVVPQQTSYGNGISMLRINGEEGMNKVKEFFKARDLNLPEGLEQDGMIDGDQLASFPPHIVKQLVQGGDEAAIMQEPLLVWSINIPGQAYPWFQDPETEEWHYNGLPHVGRGSDMPGAAQTEGLLYIGASYDASGRPVPDVQGGYLPDASGTTGMTTPVGPGVDPTVATTLSMAGEGNAPSGFTRDRATGEITEATQEQYQNQYMDVSGAAEAGEKAVKALRDAAQGAWERIKGMGMSPEERQAELNGYDSNTDPITGMPLMPLPGQRPEDLLMQQEMDQMLGGVGATQTPKDQETKTFMPPALNKVFEMDLPSIIGKGATALEESFNNLDLPKVDWKDVSAKMAQNEPDYEPPPPDPVQGPTVFPSGYQKQPDHMHPAEG